MFFLKFKTTARARRVNETKPDTENASNLNYFVLGVNRKEKKGLKRQYFEFLSRMSTCALIVRRLIK